MANKEFVIKHGLKFPVGAVSGYVLTCDPNGVASWASVGSLGGGAAGAASITSGSIDGATIGATNPNTGAFTSLSASGNLTVGGNLTVNGTATTVNSTIVTLDDPILTLGGDTAPTVDDNKDRGIEFRWHNGTAAKTGFFGFDDSTGKFVFIPDATNTSEVFSGTAGTAVLNTEGTHTGAVAATTLSASSTVNLSGLTASTSLSLDASKNIISVANTGTGNNVLATSPALAGVPTAPTAANGTNTTQIATTAFVLAQIGAIGASGSASITGGTINGATIGATTASTGAFTTLSATTLSVGGAQPILGSSSAFNLDYTGAGTQYGMTLQATTAGTTTAINFFNSAGTSVGSITQTDTAIKFNGTASSADAAPWSGITGKPTTLSGYGITDAALSNGTNASGTWGISITGSSASTTGNAATATALQTARTINGVSFNGSANISVNTVNAVTFNNGGAGAASGTTFNGGAAVTVSYNTVGAPSTTGTNASGTWGISISGNAATASSASSVSATADSAIVNQHNGNTTGWFGRILSKNATSDKAAFVGTYGASVAGVFAHNNALTAWADLYINTVDGAAGGNVRMPAATYINGNQAIHAGNYNTYAPTLTGSGASGTWGIGITGNAGSATVLQTARTINGTSFNGSANITTSSWGAARALTIGNTAKSVDGSGPVSWSLAEIGAAASSHTHTEFANLGLSQAVIFDGTSDVYFENGARFYNVSPQFNVNVRSTRRDLAAGSIPLDFGFYHAKTITGAISLTVGPGSALAADACISFILDLTNGGSAAITWWSGIKWAGGTAPTLTAAGRDVLGFFTTDGGNTWTGLVLGKDVK